MLEGGGEDEGECGLREEEGRGQSRGGSLLAHGRTVLRADGRDKQR